MLVAVRLVPFIFRRLLPFSREVTSNWSRRRRLAKRFDSYQWQKLLWIGVGLTSYIVVAADYGGSSCALAAFCLLSGGFGLAIWSRVRMATPSTMTAVAFSRDCVMGSPETTATTRQD
jgi:hypothetical protein